MIVGDPVPEEDVLLAFADSEILSRRWVGGLARHLSEAVAERVRYSPREEWTDADRSAVLAGVRALHPPCLEPLLKLGVDWHDATLGVQEVPGVYIAMLPEFRNLAPDGHLPSLVAALEKGKDTPDGEFSGGYRRTRNAFAPSQWRGRPCLAARVPRGPYTVVEGAMRLAVVLVRLQGSKPVPDAIPAYLGLTDRLADWDLAPPETLADAPAPSSDERGA